jgi:CHAT domain-containing protein
MWELFERRFETEHYLGPSVRAQRLIDRLIETSPETSGEALQAELGSLTYVDLRAFYNRAVELTGGPTGQAEGNADAERWLPHRDRLLVLRAAGSAALNEAVKARTDQLAAQDLASVEECAPIDKRIENAVRAAVAGQATDEDADRLAAAVRDYQGIFSRASLSEGGRRLFRYKIANALDSLGRACEARHRDAEAKIHFGAAAAMYAEAGQQHQAASSITKRDAADQRLVPDADTRLEQLLAELVTAPERSVDRAAVLVGLAELAHGNNDDFEAGQRLDAAIDELDSAQYPIPDKDGTDHAVETWIEAIPPGDGEDPTHFLRQFSVVLTVHSRVATLQLALRPGVAIAVEAVLYRLADIVLEIPVHAQAVDARLEAQLGQSSAPGDQLGGSPDTSAEYMAIMGIVNKLLDLTEHSSADTPETVALWRQIADDCIARARVLGQPLTLAQALEAGARVKLATGEPEAAIRLLEEEYEQASRVGGKFAADQAILAMSGVAKVQLGLGLTHVKEASEAAGRVIDLIERDRYRVSAPFQQAALLAPHADVFAIGVFAAWKNAADSTAPNTAAYDPMLQRMELSKARASVRHLFVTRAHGTTELDQELRVLNDAIHSLDPVIGPGASAEEQEHQREQARQAQQPLRQQRLQLWDRRAISRRDPDAKVPTVMLAGLQGVLEPDEAVIYYYWLRPLTLLVVTITADAIAVESKRVEQDQRTLLEGLVSVMGSLKGSNLALDAKYIEPLAAVLTPAEGQHLLEGKQRLIVSPHRLLHWYPFAAMPYQGKPLVRSFALRYAPNLTSLLVPRADPGAPRMAALAVSEFPGRPELGELRGVRREAADITSIYSAANIPSALIAEPTRAEVLGALHDGSLAGAWCLLLATHGHSLMDEVSRNAPLESVLELADDSVDGYEIAGADLECEVVVLTACYAGQRAIGGRGMAEQPGDELFGLAAAFLEAQCGSVLAPAWPADDDAMSRMITAFHRNLAEGSPADIALAQAQRAFLDAASAKECRAYYWAPLMLATIGRPMPIPGARLSDMRPA